MEKKLVGFIIFTFFNLLFGLTGLGSILGAIFLIIKSSFNSLYFIMIVFGVLIIIIFFLGLKSKNNHRILLIYLIFVIIIFFLYAGISLIIIIFNEKLITFLKSRVTDLKDDELNKIKEYKMLLFLIASIFAICSLLAFITGMVFFKKLKTKFIKNKRKEEEGDDILKGIDYSILPPDNRSN